MKKEISATNPVIFTQRPEPMHVTAHDIGCQLACDSSDMQAMMLCQWAEEVAEYELSKTESWAMQCRYIAECMTSDQCQKVRLMLETLIEHLRAIPQERLQAERESVGVA